MAHSAESIINNRYRIVNVLGQGDFGAVYEAWDVNLNKWSRAGMPVVRPQRDSRYIGRSATSLQT